MMPNNNLGWIPDLPDQRDYHYSIPTQLTLPTSYDLRPLLSNEPIYDQLALGSCTANAAAVAHQFLAPTYNPSRMFLYYNTRVLQGTQHYDSGSSIRLAFHSLLHDGIAPEYTYPYNIIRFTKRPSPTAYKRALSHQALQYLSLNQDPHTLNSCIASGFPFVFGFSVYESFYDPNPYKNLPSYNEALIGGHAVLCVGYTPTHYIIRNSWGSNYGDQGHFYLPIHYVVNPYLSADFWTLRQVELQR